VLVAVNGDRQPVATLEQRLRALRGLLHEDWSNVEVTAWAGLTSAFCHEHQSGVIVRGIRNHTDLRHEGQLAAMNEDMGITTLLVPARPGLATVSSTGMRALRA
jgi:pantetheine-phosphate adenylyltransferase